MELLSRKRKRDSDEEDNDSIVTVENDSLLGILINSGGDPAPGAPSNSQQPKGSSLICDYAGCDFIAKSRHDRIIHSSTHTGVKTSSCTYEGCPFVTNRTGSLRRHVKQVHLRDRPHKCPVEGCSYSCTQFSDMKKHEKMHNGGKSLFMSVCVVPIGFN